MGMVFGYFPSKERAEEFRKAVKQQFGLESDFSREYKGRPTHEVEVERALEANDYSISIEREQAVEKLVSQFGGKFIGT
jgi:hypothetical protein